MLLWQTYQTIQSMLKRNFTGKKQHWLTVSAAGRIGTAWLVQHWQYNFIVCGRLVLFILLLGSNNVIFY